jgi:hypothetical protein
MCILTLINKYKNINKLMLRYSLFIDKIVMYQISKILQFSNHVVH